jgi:TatD DNase family protein
MLSDAHVHLQDLLSYGDDFLPELEAPSRLVLSSIHDEAGWLALESLRARGARFLVSAGIHPQLPDMGLYPFIRRLAREGRLRAVGESGYDLFADEYASRLGEQEICFRAMLDLALEEGLPLVCHIRKGLEPLLRHAPKLKALKALVFHSWPSSREEAMKILGMGVNASFSFGTTLLKGNRKARESVAALPLDRVLLETDAPYQALKGRSHSSFGDLPLILAEAAALRGIAPDALERAVQANFAALFGDAARPQ